MAIDWDQLAFPKTRKAQPAAAAKVVKPKPTLKRGGPVKTTKRRAARNRKAQLAANVDRAVVFARQSQTCFAVAVSPVCTKRVQDPHELIPQGRGGPQESWNRVGLCRACHDAAQGRVGGNRLIFDWPGKADGAKPNADQPGHVTCRWKG